MVAKPTSIRMLWMASSSAERSATISQIPIESLRLPTVWKSNSIKGRLLRNCRSVSLKAPKRALGSVRKKNTTSASSFSPFSFSSSHGIIHVRISNSGFWEAFLERLRVLPMVWSCCLALSWAWTWELERS